MLKATARATDRVKRASFMSEFSRKILSGELKFFHIGRGNYISGERWGGENRRGN
jgi:hypothetical protein